MSCRFLWNKSCVARLVTWGRWLKTGVIILVGVLAPIDVKDQTAAHVAFVREENLPTPRQFPPCTTSPHACVCATFPLWPLYSLTPWWPQVHAQRHFHFSFFHTPLTFLSSSPSLKKKKHHPRTHHLRTADSLLNRWFYRKIHCSQRYCRQEGEMGCKRRVLWLVPQQTRQHEPPESTSSPHCCRALADGLPCGWRTGREKAPLTKSAYTAEVFFTGDIVGGLLNATRS